MKKLTKILILVLSVALLCGAFILSASAVEGPAATDHVAFVVYDNEGNVVSTDKNGTDNYEGEAVVGGETVKGYKNYITAFASIPKTGGKIVMVNNYEAGPLTEATTNNGYGFYENVTLDLNGHTFSSSYSTYIVSGSQKNPHALLRPMATSKDNPTVFTITGSGTIKTATAFTYGSADSYRRIVIDTVENNTINFEVINGYKVAADGTVSAGSFTEGRGMFRMGFATGTTGDTNLTIKGSGTVNFTNANAGNKGSFVSLFSGATLNVIDSVKINGTVSGTGSSLFIEEKCNAGKAGKPIYFNFTGATITSPKGVFIRTYNADNTNNLDENSRAIININDCELDFNGNGDDKQPDFFPRNLSCIEIRIADSEIKTDSHRVFHINSYSETMPKALIVLKNTNFDTTNNDVVDQVIVNNGGTAIIDGGHFNMDSGEYIFNNRIQAGGASYTWTLKENHEANSAVLGALPYYLDENNANYDATIEGYGHYIKDGTTFSYKTTPASGTLNYALESGSGVAFDGEKYITTAAGEYAKYTWSDATQTHKTERVVKGTEIDIVHYVFPTPTEFSDAYASGVYNAWKRVNGDAFEIFEEQTIIADEDISFTPAVGTISANFEEIYFNLGLSDSLSAQFYLAEEFTSGGVENVTFKGISIGGEACVSGGSISYSDTAYSLYNKIIGYEAFVDDVVATVSYTVTYDGIEYDLERSFSISPLKYADDLLWAEEGDPEYAYIENVANLVRFVNEFFRAKDGEHNEKINTLYVEAGCEGFCSEYEEGLLDATEADFSQIEGILDSIYIRVASGRVQLVIDFAENSKVTAVDITKIGVIEGENAWGNALIEVGGAAEKFAESENYDVYYTENLKFWNFFGIFNITVTLENGSTLEATYDVNTWYNETDMTEGQKAIWKDFFSAMKELGDSAYACRFEEVAE